MMYPGDPSSQTDRIVALRVVEQAIVARLGVRDLDRDSVKQMHEIIGRSLKESASPYVVLDLQHLQTLNSVGLTMLVNLASRTQQEDRRLILVGVNPTARAVFDLSRVGGLFTFCSSLEEAFSTVIEES